MPLEGQCYTHSVKTKSGDVVVGIRTPGGGYGKGLMPGLPPKDKGQAESVDSSPRASKQVKRQLTPPCITCPSRQYANENEKVLKGPKVIQLMCTIVEMRKEHKKPSD
jgi:hypothetical protein